MVDEIGGGTPKPWEPHTTQEIFDLIEAFAIYKCDLQLEIEKGTYKNIYGRPNFDFSKERYRVHPDYKHLLPSREPQARSISAEGMLLNKSLGIVLGKSFASGEAEAIIEITDLIRKKHDKVTLRDLSQIKTIDPPF
jgi:hypothetical protein